MSDNNQLTTASGYDTKCMIFSEPQKGSIPNSLPAINYRRIIIQTRNKDGTVGDLIFPTSTLFALGVSENKNPETGKVSGYVMPLCLWNRDGPTVEEKEWSDSFDRIIERCKEYLIEKREEIEQYDLSMSDLKKFNPLYWKRDKGKVAEGTGPILFAKLIVSKKHDTIISMFYNSEGEEIPALSLLGKYCYANAAIKIESIFIGNKISMQVKLYECEARTMETGMKRMMKKRPEGSSILSKSLSSKPFDKDSDNDSIKDDSEDEEPKVEVKQDKKVVRRTKVGN